MLRAGQIDARGFGEVLRKEAGARSRGWLVMSPPQLTGLRSPSCCHYPARPGKLPAAWLSLVEPHPGAGQLALTCKSYPVLPSMALCPQIAQRG